MKKTASRKTLAIALAAVMLATTWAAPASADKAAPEGAPALTESAAGNGKASANGTAATAIDKAKAEQLLRQYVNIPKEYKLQGASSGTTKKANGSQSYWSLSFVKSVNGKQTGSIHASLDSSTGQLLSFNAYSDKRNAAPPTYPLKVDREDAKALAAEFISQVAGGFKSEVKLNESFGLSLLPPLTGAVRHTLRYERLVNGIAFPSNYIQVELDSDGHVQGFELNWDDTVEFPKANASLSEDDAATAIRKAAEPQLRYIIPYNAQGKPSPVLSYNLPAFAVDASTGERSDGLDFYGYPRGTVSETPLSEKPGAKPKPGKLAEEAARQAVEKAFGLPSGYALENATYSEYEEEATGKTRASWDLNWTLKKEGRDVGGAWASVDGDTGTVRSFYQYNQSTAEDPAYTKPITLETAVEKAKETVRKQLPWLADELYVVTPDSDLYKDRTPEEIGNYGISFEHKVHGATVEYDHVSVGIDAKTGGIQSFEASVADYAYPAKKPAVLSAADAVEKWLGYYETKLQYRMNTQYWWDGQPLPIEKVKTLIAAGEADGELLEQKVSVELVYQLTAKPVHEDVYLDAVTGDWISRETGEKTALELPRATDAAGHWAEDSLQLMVAYKALDLQDGQVRPNEAITRGELIKMLVLASSGGRFGGYDTAASGDQEKAMFNDVAADSAYFAYVQSAVANNLIDVGDGSFNPEGKVTRDEMAELIVRALGYNSLANVDHIFKVSFKDEAEIENKGQAAIVVGLKIMSLSNGRYLPEKQVTRAEASIAFYRYLQKRAELKENPLRM
ncbi:S-layer homology domain-containing protein [Paenibacillus sp. LHD-117]|uniref:S-layer homology domain-containing protein n=1 Tax=Paenibacillus sp. LHD-117 TaxID=3071412 RepID=UPI0027E17308|nr:S-layer homology domain-containing protein [Paenibacillus sp. LHD-117]MDQ6421004.1 S-layer homology domain-containing protein [Paenibacillus sp. LHD-117]